MDAIRENLTTIPAVVSNFINESASTATSFLNGWQSQTPMLEYHATGQEIYRGLPIPASLVKEQWRFIFPLDASAIDYEAAIAHCRDLVLITEECSEERRWLVRHLIDLRYMLTEIREAEAINAAEGDTSSPSRLLARRSIVGHHFQMLTHNNQLQAATKYDYCDHCTGIIWNVAQVSYKCENCSFLAHRKCLEGITRVCAHVVASERVQPIDVICPEIGLAAQQYKCAECGTRMNFTDQPSVEPRLCDYTGQYYCTTCHWNDRTLIPARVIHNWEFTPQKVSRASFQELQLLAEKPLINLELANPKLFIFLESLSSVKKLRQKLVHVRKYLVECKDAVESKLIEQELGVRRRLIQSSELYSLNDLMQAESGELASFLQRAYNALSDHVRKCIRCTGKAYICEICSNCQVLFPFDDACVACDKCNSVYHRSCMSRKNNACPKCKRLEERRLIAEQENLDTEADENAKSL